MHNSRVTQAIHRHATQLLKFLKTDVILYGFTRSTNTRDIMKNIPRISDSEWKIMKILWRRAPQPAYDIAEEISRTENWDIRTVKTFLSRLVKKGALSYRKYKNLYLYFPIVSEEKSKQQQGESFLNQVFDGSMEKMFLHFAKSKKLSEDQLEQLRRIAEQMED